MERCNHCGLNTSKRYYERINDHINEIHECTDPSCAYRFESEAKSKDSKICMVCKKQIKEGSGIFMSKYNWIHGTCWFDIDMTHFYATKQ